MYAKVENNKVTSTRLPKTATLLDGRTVSGFNLLSPEQLKVEGWLPLEENKPAYNPETEHLTNMHYIIGEDIVTRTWDVEVLPIEPQEPEIDYEKLALYEAIAGLQERLEALEGGSE